MTESDRGDLYVKTDSIGACDLCCLSAGDLVLGQIYRPLTEAQVQTRDGPGSCHQFIV